MWLELFSRLFREFSQWADIVYGSTGLPLAVCAVSVYIWGKKMVINFKFKHSIWYLLEALISGQP